VTEGLRVSRGLISKVAGGTSSTSSSYIRDHVFYNYKVSYFFISIEELISCTKLKVNQKKTFFSKFFI
jgi:hypothetical protein